MEYKLQKFKSGMHYFLLDEADVVDLMVRENKRVVCKLNDAFCCLQET
jgi:hypothetical protein